jgi:hypothetical protein
MLAAVRILREINKKLDKKHVGSFSNYNEDKLMLRLHRQWDRLCGLVVRVSGC